MFQQELIACDRIIRIYLDELPSGSIGIDLIELIVSKEAQAPKLAKQLMQRTEEISNVTVKQHIVELVLECLVSKFSNLTRQEIEAMFLVSDLKQTRFYQDVRQDVRQEEAETLLIRQLTKRFGKLNDRYQTQISALEITQLEDLAEALLDFQSISDLNLWLEQKLISRE